MLSIPYYLATKYKRILDKSEQEKLFAQFLPLRKLLAERGLLDKYGLPDDLDAIALLQTLHPKTFKLALRAKDKLIYHNQRELIRIAQKYLNQGLEEEDVLTWGNLGLTRAIWKFNPDKGTKFSSYAWFWIHESIKQGLRFKQMKFPKCQTGNYIFTSLVKCEDGEYKDIFEYETISNDSLIDLIYKDLSDVDANCLTRFYGLDGHKPEVTEKEKALSLVERIKECWAT